MQSFATIAHKKVDWVANVVFAVRIGRQSQNSPKRNLVCATANVRFPPIPWKNTRSLMQNIEG